MGDSPTRCDEAQAHIDQCVGTQPTIFGDRCDLGEADVLLDTPCEVLSEASLVQADLKADQVTEEPLSCLLFGIGCPVDMTCFEPLSESSTLSLIALSDVERLGDEYDVQERIEQIAALFKNEPDPRGIFAIVYRLITNNAVASVEEGIYENEQWTRELIIAFARRYLINLHGHLTGGPVSPQWQTYYRLAQHCGVSYGRTLGVAIATHLMIDLPYALEDVNSVAIHEDDFMLFGEVSLRIFPDLISDMQEVYKTDVSRLLQGFFLGDWIDTLYTKGTATTFIYQTVRRNAWRNSQNLQRFPRAIVHADITTGWGLAEVFLATLDATGAL